MRRIALAALLSLSACATAVPVEPPPPAAPAPAPAPAPGVITQDQAIDAAFEIARERGLEVTRVRYARLDQSGRWLVEVGGDRDRARVLLDARDGRLIKGRFREGDPELE